MSVESLPSTQDDARNRFSATGRATLVVADHQSRGRGRQGRSWEEPTRGLFSSLALGCDWPMYRRAVITLCTAVALSESIEGLTGVRCDVKWPNDLLIEGKKVAGILVESEGESVTVGCGVNLWWPDAPDAAGALFADEPSSDLPMGLATGWVDVLLEILDAGPHSWPRDEYVERSWTLGRSVEWDGGSGRAVGIARDGGLVVDTRDGEMTITAGEVHTREAR